MIPYSYNMVDMGGIDLAEVNGTVVDGLYNRLVLARNACGDLILFNWKFAEIEIAPGACSTIDAGTSILINGAIQVTEQDEVSIVGISPKLEELLVYENGLYRPSEQFIGYSQVTVSVPKSNFNILCNWDMNNIVNTRGQSSYRSGYGFDGWSTYQGVATKVEGGIILEKGSSYGFMLQGQFLSSGDAVRALYGKLITISAVVGDQLGSYTFVPSSAGDQDQGHLSLNGVEFFFFRDNITQMPFYMGVYSDTPSNVIRAVKVEFGGTQTLATIIDGRVVLNEVASRDQEYFRVRASVRN